MLIRQKESDLLAKLANMLRTEERRPERERDHELIATINRTMQDLKRHSGRQSARQPQQPQTRIDPISRNHPRFAQRIETIARAICPNTTNAGLREQALIIGE